MANKRNIDLQILAQNPSTIPQLATQPFRIVDKFASIVYPWSDGYFSSFAALNSSNPTAAVSWSAQPHFDSITNLLFARFLKNGRIKFGAHADNNKEKSPDVAGFFIKPNVFVYDSRIGDNADDVSGGGTRFDWTATAGDWETCLPPETPLRTMILNTGSTAFNVAISSETIAANRSVAFDLFFEGADASSNTQPEISLVIGDKWVLRFARGEKLQLQKVVNNVYTLYKTFADGPTFNMQGQKVTVVFWRLNGRGCIKLVTGDGAEWDWWFYDTTEPFSVFAGAGQGRSPKVKDVTWPESTIVLTAFNVRVRCGLRAVMWATSIAGTTPKTGSLSRSVVRNTDLGGAPSVTSSTAGWVREGTTCGITPSLPSGAASYSLSVSGSASGIDSPFVTKAVVKWTPTPTAPSVTTLDLRHAVKTCNVKLALPHIAAGSVATITLDRTLLDKLSAYNNWDDTLKPYSPITIKARWYYQDDTRDSWTTIFKGYAYKLNKRRNSPGDDELTITCMDDTVRLKAPAATVDHKHPPLDVKFMLDASAAVTANSSGSVLPAFKFYGGECVQEIARMFLGDAMADGINGNGDTQRYFPANHPPLLDATSETGGYLAIATALGEATTLPPVSMGAWRFPAPHGSDAWSWLSQFAKDDRAALWFKQGVLYYGRMRDYLASRTPVEIPDANYSSGDINKLIVAAETENRPEKDINTVNVWSLEVPELSGLIPALRMAQSRITDPDDPNRAELSWERADTIRTALATFYAEDMANRIISEMSGVVREWPTVTFRGVETLTAGDILYFDLSGSVSDTSGGLVSDTINGGALYVRSEVIEHNFDIVGGLQYTTRATCRPLTTSERTAAGI